MSIPGAASPLFLSAAAAADAAHQIDRSLRFNDGDSPSLSRTVSSASNQKKWTWSGWFKRGSESQPGRFFSAGPSSTNRTNIFLYPRSSNLGIGFYSLVNGTLVGQAGSDPVLADHSAWYHLVFAFDAANSTTADRLKIYINSVEQSVTYSVAVSNIDHYVNSNTAHYVGRGADGYSFDGYLAEINFVDGQALAPTDFGEYDANNVWQPKAYSGSYGTNGFYLKFADNSSSAALGTDSSGNSNTFTVNNLQAAAGASSDSLTAVSFDGVDDKLTLGTDSNLQLSGVFTLEAWIYRVGTNNEVGIFEGSAGGIGSCVVRVASNMLGLERHNTAFDILSSGTVPTDQWVHVAITRDSQNTCRAFINGTHDGTSTNNTHQYSGDFRVGQTNNGYFESAVSNLRLIKGTCLYTSNFTPPTTPLSNVTNTVLLICQDSSSATAATVKPSGTTIGTGGSPTAGSYPIVGAAEVDSLLDTPTNYTADSGNNGGNYATLNPLAIRVNGGTMTNGNLTLSASGSQYIEGKSTIEVLKFNNYCELTITGGDTNTDGGFGIGDHDAWVAGGAGSYITYRESGAIISYPGNTTVATVNGWTQGDVLGMAVDSTSIKFYKNGSLQGTYSHGKSGTFFAHVLNLASNSNAVMDINFGQRPFAYTPPTGYVSLCTQNLTDPTIADGSTAFNATLYTGNGSARNISTPYGPDFVWIKSRSASYDHGAFDVLRGANQRLNINSNGAEGTEANSVTAFNSDSFSLGSLAFYNNPSTTFVAWNWNAGTSTVSNTDGSITSSVRANASAGFSIVSFTGDGSGTDTIGHGLNATPQLIILKDRDSATDWLVYTQQIDGSWDFLYLNKTDAKLNSSYSAATSSVFSYGTDAADYIAYCISPVAGFSAVGSYTGNGSSDGPFVFTGFRVAWLMIKNTSTSGETWTIYDSARDVDNPAKQRLQPNSADAESVGSSARFKDLLSNGFKIRGTSGEQNTSGDVYIYVAFAEHPFKTARAR